MNSRSRSLSAFGMTVGYFKDLDTGYVFEIREENTWAVIENHSAATIAVGDCSLASGYNTLLVVRLDQYMAVFLNGELLCELHDLEFPGNRNAITVRGQNNSSGKFDVVDFWNLDGVDFLY